MKQEQGSMTAQQASGANALRERAEMLIRISQQTGLPLDDSGPPELSQAIAEIQRLGPRSV